VFIFLANSNMFAAPTPAPTERVILPSLTQTQIAPTETAPPTITSTAEAALPTDTPFPSEIKDEKTVAMIYIPAGEFTMGSDTSGDIGSHPSHKVNVAAFYIDKYEVTNKSYGDCAYAVECRKPSRQGSATRNTYFTNQFFAGYPVIYIDWKMANAYCAWRGARLPTEAEWEKAARGTDERVYPWGGGEISCSFANVYGCIGDTDAVDQYEKGKSFYGVFGMSGNVWEWTSSLFANYPYDANDGREDQVKTGERMARGGGWNAFGGNSTNARLDTRLKLDPGHAGPYVGVRCARSVSP
jgi:serine/threonine-protein kinase